MPNLYPITSNRPIVNEGRLNQEGRAWAQQVYEKAPMVGRGTPLGVVEATQGRIYIDLDGIPGSRMYIKEEDYVFDGTNNDSTLGWELV